MICSTLLMYHENSPFWPILIMLYILFGIRKVMHTPERRKEVILLDAVHKTDATIL